MGDPPRRESGAGRRTGGTARRCRPRGARSFFGMLFRGCRFRRPSFDALTEVGPAGRETGGPGSKHQKEKNMRFMVIVKANKDSEAGVLPDRKILAEMGKFNEELVKAGVMLAGEGLQPSSKGARVRFDGNKRTVIDGPFAETKELVAGFWLWQCKSKEEAIEWLKRAPFGGGTEVEIRQVFETEDFGAEMTPEMRDREDRLRREIAQKK